MESHWDLEGLNESPVFSRRRQPEMWPKGGRYASSHEKRCKSFSFPQAQGRGLQKCQCKYLVICISAIVVFYLEYYPRVDGETAVLGRCFVVLMTNVIFTPVKRWLSGRHDKATRLSWCWCRKEGNSCCNLYKPIPVWPWIRTCSR